MPDLSFVEFTDRLAQPFKVTSFTFNGVSGLQHTNGFVQTDGDGNLVGLSATTPMFYRLTDGTNAYDARQIRELDAGTDSVGAAQSGSWSVAVNNFPAEYALPVSQVLALTPQTNALTDAQLRAAAVPVSAVSLPLPTGAATEATLSALNGKFNTLGQKTAANSVPVALASDQATITNPLAITWSIGGAAASATNPAPVQLSQNNQPLSATNPLHVMQNTNEATTYFAGFAVVPTTLTTGLNYFWIRNTDPTKKIRIERIECILVFTGTAAGSRSNYLVRKFINATATTGNAVTIEKGQTSNANSIADVKWSPTGGTLTGATPLNPFFPIGHANQLSANIVYDRNLSDAPIVLGQNEGIVLQSDGAIVNGSTVYFSLRWEEV